MLGKDDTKGGRKRRSVCPKDEQQEEAYQKALASGPLICFSVTKNFRGGIREISGDREDRLGFLKQEDFGSEEWKDHAKESFARRAWRWQL